MKQIISDFINRKKNEKAIKKEMHSFAEDMILYVQDLDVKNKVEGIEIKVNERTVTENLQDPMANTVATIELPDEDFTWKLSDEVEVKIKNKDYQLNIYDYHNISVFEMYKNDEKVFLFSSSFGKEDDSELFNTLKIYDDKNVIESIKNINEKISQQDDLKNKNRKRNSYKM